MSGRSISICLAVLLVTGCRKSDMAEQPRFKPYQPTVIFPDQSSARPLVEGTVVHGQAHTDELMYNGTVNERVANLFPFTITRDDVQRGRLQFDIFCSVCHGRTGEGNGMIVQRGFTPPSSFHTDRLRKAPAGHFYQVITNGLGAMYGYAERITPDDRWRIAAYIRALQLSQNADPSEVDAVHRKSAEANPVVPLSELDGYTGPRGKVGVDQ